MFESIEYTVERLDGDYAYLKNEAAPEEELKCVARALLPAEVGEGTKLAYEMFQYSVI
ncbi:MAG: chorismate--pyruvate lyase [Eubacterium sp.]|nr:chorismate--pyruvate lyase [Eubacterium sp.]